MSLFLGNLSSHIHEEDLEDVFQRFGKCSIRMKDGYAFAVFEVPSNAEKALIVLRGKLICGERINISWSNKQPRNFQKFTRSNRFYEPYGRRNFRDGDMKLNRFEHDKRGFVGHQANNHRAFHINNTNENVHLHSQRTDLVGDVRQGSTSKVIAANEFFSVEDGRWGDPVSNNVDDNTTGDGADFERYEPNHGHNGKEIDENGNSGSYGSPAREGSLVKGKNSGDAQLESLDKLRKQPICYNCGLLGHVKRNCLRGVSRLDKPIRFRSRKFNDKHHGGKDKEEPNRKVHKERREASRDALASGECFSTEIQHKNRKHTLKGRGKTLKDEGISNHETEVDPTRKKRNGHDQRLPKRRLKKRKSHHSVSLDSDATNSLSHSSSSRSDTKSTSMSNSHPASSSPSDSHSHSCKSRSLSMSSYSTLKNCPKGRRMGSRLKPISKAGSRSRSKMSIPESLSISLDEKPVSPIGNTVANNFVDLPFNGHLKDSDTLNYENLEHVIHSGHEQALNGKVGKDSTDPGDANCKRNPDNWLEVCNFHDDAVIVPAMKHSQIHSFGTHSLKGEQLDIAMDASINLKGDSCWASDVRNSIGVSTEEMLTVFKHYGIESPKKSGQRSTVGTLLGAVRFWPWELIYYRRLKKGPISTENYARRFQQNKDFGIVDKYIRSSSGWGECIAE